MDEEQQLKPMGNLPCDVEYGYACAKACTYVTLLPHVRVHVRPAIQVGVRSDAHLNTNGACDMLCPLGFSPLERMVLALLGTVCAQLLPYARLARKFQTIWGIDKSEDAIRGVVYRLGKRGFLQHRQARRGMLRGVCITLEAEKLCPHILIFPSGVHEAVRQAAHCGAQASPLEQIDRKENLSILGLSPPTHCLLHFTGEDLAFHWPCLAGAGFGVEQVQQIVARLEQVGESTERLTQALTYAEWELERDTMRDRHGNSVKSPVSWVFKILASQGYYPRPQGYVSPQEQAEKDALEEERRLEELRKIRINEAFTAWSASLTAEERQRLGGTGGRPCATDDMRLRVYFKQHVWAKTAQQDTGGGHA